MTGFSHFSSEVMQSWNSWMWRRKDVAVRAESEAEEESWPCDAAVTSRPAVKAGRGRDS